MSPGQARQRRGWGALALALVAMGVCGGWLLLRGEEPSQALAIRGRQGSASSVMAAAATPGSGVVAQPALSAPAQAQVARPPPHLGDVEASVQGAWALYDRCAGKARLNTSAESEYLAGRNDVVRTARRRVALADRLQRDVDSQKQAAGSLLQALEARNALCESDDCAEHGAAQARIGAAAVQRLATSAANSANSTVYAWAFVGCGVANYESTAPAACLQITPARWAQISPNSGLAWLAVAVGAWATKDVSLMEAALQRITASNADWSNPGAAFQQTLVDAMAASKVDPGQPDMTTLLPATSTVQAVFSGLIGSLPRYCPASMDANRQQGCARLARHMLSRVGSIEEQQIALKVAAAAGLDKSELAPYIAEQEHAAKLLSFNLEEGAQPSPAFCAKLNKARELSYRMNQIGELAALREVLALPSAGDGNHRH